MIELIKRLLLYFFIVYGCTIPIIFVRSHNFFFFSSYENDDVAYNIDDFEDPIVRDEFKTDKGIDLLNDKKDGIALFERAKELNSQTSSIDIKENDILDQLKQLTFHGVSNSSNCPKPLTFYNDRVVENSSYQNQPIPLILHVSMRSRCIPQDLTSFMKRWEEKLPDASVFFHDDDAVESLLQQSWPEFPMLKTLMQCVQYKGAMKIDVWRLLVVYKYGGIYTDIDNWPPDSFNQLWFTDKSISAFFFSDTNARPSQWFFATEPRHLILYHAIIQALNNIAEMVNIGRPSVVQVTGPEALKSGFSMFFPEEDRNKVLNYDGGNFTGLFSKKVRKISLPETTQSIKVAYKYDDIVPFNSTLNVTRRERIEMQSGVVHWDHHIHRSFKNGYGFRGSCIKYLAHLDKDGTTNHPHVDTKGSSHDLNELIARDGMQEKLTEGDINCTDRTTEHYVNKLKLKSMKSNIPLVLHVATESKCLTKEESNIVTKWQKALPNASIFIHDNDAVENLLKKHWPEFPYLEMILQCVQENNSMVHDLWKFLVLYQYGGIVTSLANRPGDDFKESWFSDKSISALFFTETDGNQTSPSIIGIEPRHSIMYYTILRLLENYMRLSDVNNLGNDENLGSTSSLLYGYRKNFHHEMDENNLLFVSKETIHDGLFAKKVRKLSLETSLKAFVQNEKAVKSPRSVKSRIRRRLDESKTSQSCKQYLKKLSFELK